MLHKPDLEQLADCRGEAQLPVARGALSVAIFKMGQIIFECQSEDTISEEGDGSKIPHRDGSIK